MSLNFGQFPAPTLPINAGDFVVGYQLLGTNGVPTLAQYTMLQLAGVIGPLIPSEPPSGPAGGDLSGTYPNPTVAAVHATSGTLAGVAVTTSTVDSTPVGATTASTGKFTSLASTSGTLNGTLGATTPSTAAVTTLSASGAVSGAGFTALFASPPPLGSTAPSSVAATTVTASGTITPSQTAGIVGTTAVNNANAGSVGEYIVTALSASTGITAGTATNIQSISLTAGDWDVQGDFTINGTGTITNVLASLSLTSATSGATGALTQLNATVNGTTGATPLVRVSVAATTTVFLVGFISTVSAAATTQGLIRARRVR